MQPNTCFVCAKHRGDVPVPGGVVLLPRYVGTPREYWWDRVDEWPDAPRGGEQAVVHLVERLVLAARRPG